MVKKSKKNVQRFTNWPHDLDRNINEYYAKHNEECFSGEISCLFTSNGKIAMKYSKHMQKHAKTRKNHLDLKNNRADAGHRRNV